MERYGGIAVLIAIVFGTHADGAIVTFASRASFDAAFPSAMIEDWDSFADGTTFANGSTVNGITYNSSTEVAVVTDTFVPSTAPNTLGRTTFEFFLGDDTMTFGFSAPIVAFGVDLSTGATTDGSYTATTDLGDVAASVFDPFPGFTGGQFIGFVSDTPFSSVTIAAVTPDFGYVLDTLRHQTGSGGVVPEPYAFLVWAGLALIAAIHVRRQGEWFTSPAK
jgi:hypothetical protein